MARELSFPGKNRSPDDQVTRWVDQLFGEKYKERILLTGRYTDHSNREISTLLNN